MPSQPYAAIFIMKADGTGLRQLTDSRWEDAMPRFVPRTARPERAGRDWSGPARAAVDCDSSRPAPFCGEMTRADLVAIVVPRIVSVSATASDRHLFCDRLAGGWILAKSGRVQELVNHDDLGGRAILQTDL